MERASEDEGADARKDADADTDADTDAPEDEGGAEDEAEQPDEGTSEAPEEEDDDRTEPSGEPLTKRLHLLLGLVFPAVLLVANMWRVRTFTVDDSYISYRYARNLARGLGLVYNEGERIEGYTNFLWTVLLAGGIRIGIDPDVFAKVAGGLAALGALGVTYTLAQRLKPFHTLPCVATWLLASTVVFSGYAVFGLETALFGLLVLSGTLLFFRESEAAAAGAKTPFAKGVFPFSGIVFGLAGITRPEAPMFIGILMLYLGRRMFAAQNLLRGALFVLPVAAHVLWRHSYYGAWLPNTLSAKTGNLEGQISGGWSYVQNYFNHAGPVLYLGLFGVALGLVHKRREVLAIATIAGAVLGYVILVGGDWMPFFRFMAPFEPFAFIIVDLAAREIVDRRSRPALLAMAAFTLAMIGHRAGSLRDAQSSFVNKEEKFWKTAAGGTATWLLQNEPGEVALGDIGYVGYATDYPILDLLGLVDPVISKLPGGYTRKLGPGFTDRLFTKAPKYVLIISSNVNCEQPSVPGSQVIYRDARFKAAYAVAGKVRLDQGFAWCLFKRKPEGAQTAGQPASQPASQPALPRTPPPPGLPNPMPAAPLTASPAAQPPSQPSVEPAPKPDARP